MVMSDADVVDMVAATMLPKWNAERTRLNRLDNWLRWNHDDPHKPRAATNEYRQLIAKAQTPWLGLVVTSVAQALYVEGYRRSSDEDNSQAWSIWQANGLDARQIAVHRAALGYGASYVTVLPGKTLTGDAMPAVRGVSPRQMMAFYADAADDDWPTMALRIDTAGTDRRIRVYDGTSVYHLTQKGTTGKPTFVRVEEHGVGVCPVIRFANLLDLEGRTDGEVEPFIPVAARIDQTTFDRLVVQRFASWVVRTVAGMSMDETIAATGETPQQAKLRLSADSLLVATDPATKFGSLPASPLDGFISAHESDVRALAAVTQTPAHELLGSLANLSAEALAAARASLTAKIDERRHSFGESWEQVLRLAAFVSGDTEGANDFEAQVRWKDTEIRSLSQAADALGKLATMLGVPAELLWEKIPGWTDQDIERAKILVQQDDGLAALLRNIVSSQTPAPAALGSGA